MAGVTMTSLSLDSIMPLLLGYGGVLTVTSWPLESIMSPWLGYRDVLSVTSWPLDPRQYNVPMAGMWRCLHYDKHFRNV